MDNDQNQDEYDSLENVEEINEGILNTPAEEKENKLPVIDGGQQMDTFMKFNRLPDVKTDEGIVLDLGGEKAAIDEGDFTSESGNHLFNKITGQGLEADGLVNPSAFFIIFLVAAATFGFLLINFKRSEEMGKLQEEINKIKNKTNKIV